MSVQGPQLEYTNKTCCSVYTNFWPFTIGAAVSDAVLRRTEKRVFILKLNFKFQNSADTNSIKNIYFSHPQEPTSSIELYSKHWQTSFKLFRGRSIWHTYQLHCLSFVLQIQTVLNSTCELLWTICFPAPVHGYLITEQLFIRWAIGKNHQKVSGYQLSALHWRMSYREVVNRRISCLSSDLLLQYETLKSINTTIQWRE